MPPSERLIDQLADAILDGSTIDWTAAESSADGTAQSLFGQLRVLAALADLHRSTPPTPSTLPPSRTELNAADAPVMWSHLRLVERIGRGAFGEVYRAWDTRLDREVALKLLPADSSSGDGAASAIIHEGRLLARVRHPNVVTIHGAEQIAGQIGLWMEFVRGRTLEQILDQRKVVSAAEAVAIGLELCRAMSAVHGAGLLHRDIKTHNVMRAEDGRIVLMDFGAGRELEDDAASDLAGTPLYLAPEVLQGQRATVRSDIYSLGVLLYHLVAGSYPVQARTVREVRRAHERGERTAVQAVRSDVPSKFARVIERAIDPRPERFDEAIGQCRKTLELDPAYFWARTCLAFAYAQRGDDEQAVRELERDGSSRAQTPFVLADLGYVYARAGRSDDARSVLAELTNRSPREYVPPYALALVYAGLGENGRALEFLERAGEERSPRLVFLGVEPTFDGLRGDPRFAAFRRKLGLP